MPPRATERQGATTRAATGIHQHLQPAITTLHTNIVNAFASFDSMISSLEGPANRAVNGARDRASAQVRDTRNALREAVQQGGISAETALIRQHDAARRQMVDATRTRAEQERTAAERGTAGRISTAASLAGNQAATVRAVLTGLEPERQRPPGEFATIVVRSARGMQDRVGQNAASQRPKLARSVPQTIATLDSTSAATSTRMQGRPAEIGGKFVATAEETGTALAGRWRREPRASRRSPADCGVDRSDSSPDSADLRDQPRRTWTRGCATPRTEIDDAFAGRASGSRVGQRAPPRRRLMPNGPTEAADAFVGASPASSGGPRQSEIAAFADTARGAVRIGRARSGQQRQRRAEGLLGPGCREGDDRACAG